jgi:hypothetical protein
MVGTPDEMLPDLGPEAAQQVLRAAAEVRVFDGRATAGLVLQRLIEVIGGAMILVAVVFGSVLVGGWVWITVGLLVVLLASGGPVGRLAGAEPRRWPFRWRAALVTALIVLIVLDAMGLLGSWASSGTWGPPLVVGPAVTAFCYLLAPVVRWVWSLRRPAGTTPWPDGSQAFAVLSVLSRVQWMHPDRLAELTGLPPSRCLEWVQASVARGLAVPATSRRFFSRNAEITATGLARLDTWTAELTEQAARAQPWTSATAPTSPAVSSVRSSSDVT